MKAERLRYALSRFWSAPISGPGRRSSRSRRPIPFAWLLRRLSREGRTLATLTCASALFATNAGQSQAFILLLATASLLASALLFTRAFRLDGVTARLAAPPRIFVGDEATLEIQLSNDTERAHQQLRIEVPRLSRDGTFTELPAEVGRLPAHARASSLARVQFTKRGVHVLEPFRAALLLPLGLSQGPAASTAPTKIVVVPRVAQVTRVTTPQNRRHQPGGVSQASRRGDSSELIGVRPYRPGDPIRQLHARSWARSGAPMVREYQEEYFARIGVVVDLDGRAGTPKVEAALSLAAGIIERLCRGEALIDVLVTGDHVEPMPVGRGTGSFEHALDVLARAHATAGFSGDRLLAELAPFMARLSSLVLVCVAWDDARKTFVGALQQHGVPCRAAIVGNGKSSDHATWISTDAITSGQEVAL